MLVAAVAEEGEEEEHEGFRRDGALAALTGSGKGEEEGPVGDSVVLDAVRGGGGEKEQEGFRRDGALVALTGSGEEEEEEEEGPIGDVAALDAVRAAAGCSVACFNLFYPRCRGYERGSSLTSPGIFSFTLDSLAVSLGYDSSASAYLRNVHR